MPDDGELVFLGPPVVPVQVTCLQGAPVVTNYYTVYVDHWHYLENEPVPQLLEWMSAVNEQS